MGGIYISYFTFYRIAIALLFLTTVSCRSNTDKSPSKTTLYCTLPDSAFSEGNYSAHKAYQEPIIDGKILENSWAFARWATLPLMVNDTLCNKIKYKITWDENAVFVLILSDPQAHLTLISLKINNLVINTLGLDICSMRNSNVIESKIPLLNLDNEITLPIQFIISCKKKKYISQQGYVKLVL